MEPYPTWCALKNFTAGEFFDLQNLLKHIPIEHPYYEKKLFDKIANANANTYTTIEFTKDDVFVNCLSILLQYR